MNVVDFFLIFIAVIATVVTVYVIGKSRNPQGSLE